MIAENEGSLLSKGLETAKLIASKSPIAVQGSKINLNFSRENKIEDGLKFVVRIFKYFKLIAYFK